MKRAARILSVLSLSLLALTTPSAGQLTTSLERLEIVLWPEYDRPELLVMLRGWIAEEIPVPTYVPLPMPAGVSPSAVAKRDPSGQLLLAAHTVLDFESRREVRIATESREVRLEYYAPLTRDGATRSYVFDWPGLVALGSVAYELQQPVGAESLRVEPSPRDSRVGFDGLTYHTAELGPRAVGEGLSIELSYSKQSNVLTHSVLQPTETPPPPAPTVAPPRTEETVVVPPEAGSFPWLIALPVVLIGGLILVWFLHSGPRA